MLDDPRVQVFPSFIPLLVSAENAGETECWAVYGLDAGPSHQFPGHKAFGKVATMIKLALVRTRDHVAGIRTSGAPALQVQDRYTVD